MFLKERRKRKDKEKEERKSTSEKERLIESQILSTGRWMDLNEKTQQMICGITYWVL